MLTLLVCNPAAGGGRAGAVIGPVRDHLLAGGAEVEVHRTSGLADARDAAAAAAGRVDAVIALGGDGTVGACAAGLVAVPGRRAALGIVPAGGGNDAAVALGVPTDDLLAAAGLLAGFPRRGVDLVRTGARTFLNVAGAGLDAEVNRLGNRLPRLPGRLRYAAPVVAALATFRPGRFTLDLDGRREEVDAWFVAVANGPSYGAGVRIAPHAVMDDGLLDVVVVGAMRLPALARTYPKVFSGRHLDHPDVRVFRARRIAMTASRPHRVYADGEEAGTVPAEFTVLPSALDVLASPTAPALAPWRAAGAATGGLPG